MSAEERTEQATPKRRERARAAGEQPRSALASYAAAAWLIATPCAFGPRLCAWWTSALTQCASEAASDARSAGAIDVAACAIVLARAPEPWIAVALVWLVACAGALASAAACGAIGWSAGALRWRLERLAPLAGMKSMLSRDALVQTFVASCAAAAVLGGAFEALRLTIAGAAARQELRLETAVGSAALAAFWWRAALALTVVACVDVVLARRRHAARLRMTPREVRDERAEQEGRPEVKGRRRAIAARRVRRLRVAAIRRAAAVVTNPTHVAVALHYDPPDVDVPAVVALGAGAGAAIVRAAAAFYAVPVIESPDLARALYARVDVDEPIPEDLYAAVAAVFAWILRTRGRLGSLDTP